MHCFCAYISVNNEYLHYSQQYDHTEVHPMVAQLEVQYWESSSNHDWPPGPSYTDLFLQESIKTLYKYMSSKEKIDILKSRKMHVGVVTHSYL